jgi:organic hydroperoxide reductase OsmC/OhrA
MNTHQYSANIIWTGNTGTGTSDYASYSRDHVISIDDKQDLQGSSDSIFRGDVTKHNPEDMLLSSLSVCHMLWYLHLCADAGVIVTAYTDKVEGVLEYGKVGGRFTEVTLHPIVTVASEYMIPLAMSLHSKAHDSCFIANSVNFPVKHQATVLVKLESTHETL